MRGGVLFGQQLDILDQEQPEPDYAAETRAEEANEKALYGDDMRYFEDDEPHRF